MGATEQAVADAQRLLTSPDDALSLAQVLEEQGHSIYLQHNRRQEWEEYLAILRSRYSRKYKLIGLLREFN